MDHKKDQNNQTKIHSEIENGKEKENGEDQIMSDTTDRAKLLLGEQAMDRLKNATVLVAGIGGVGSFAAEALARSQIGHLILIDKDVVEPSNINRQLVAGLDTIGQSKVDVMKKRIANLNPACKVDTFECFYDANMNETLAALKPDLILDCIDSIGSKKDLIRFAQEHDIDLISSMGMARKKDPSLISFMELEQTSYDPIAKILRVWKRKEKLRKPVWVVSSKEPPMNMEKGSVLPSMIFVPASAGLLMASKAVSALSRGSRLHKGI